MKKKRSSRRDHPPRVAMAYQTGLPHLERIIAGVMDFARKHGPWQFAFSPEASTITLENLANGWTGDGVLAMIELPKQFELAKKLRCPVVNLSGAMEPAGVPTVLGDNIAIGRTAAAHFLERGFSRFAFYGLKSMFYSEERRTGFADALKALGYGCDALLTGSSLHAKQPWHWNRSELNAWLLELRKPVGILAVHDYRACMILEACRTLQIAVPGEVAVIGVNNDPLACASAIPPLSSIPQEGATIGWHAASVLARLMKGNKPTSLVQRIAPASLVARGSTDTTGVEDKRLAHAVAMMRSTLATPVGIDAIAESSGLSRRRLEQLFSEQLHCSPHDYLVKLRLKHARECLVRNPELKLSAVAKRCGFHDARRMGLQFREHFGVSPREIRAAEERANHDTNWI